MLVYVLYQFDSWIYIKNNLNEIRALVSFCANEVANRHIAFDRASNRATASDTHV